MEQLSFVEKLGILFDNILAHPFFICLLLLPVLVIFFNKKITKKAVVLIYIGVLAVILFIGNTTLFALFDNLVDGIFMALYFPNFITLFLVEVLSAVICLVTFLKKDITKTSKIINITGFAIIQTLFALILTVVQANEIDIYKENALYASNDVLTLMQLLMGAFALQIITFIVVKAIEKVTAKLDGTDKPKEVLPEGRISHAKVEELKITPKSEVKAKPKIKKEPAEVLTDIKPKEVIKPLDKTLILESKIVPVDLNEEIKKEKLENSKKEALKENNQPLEPLKEDNPFDSFKPVYPTENTKFINKSAVKPDLLKPMEEVKPKDKAPKKKQITSSDELITNLQIVDFDKMVKAIKNLSTVYTM